MNINIILSYTHSLNGLLHFPRDKRQFFFGSLRRRQMTHARYEFVTEIIAELRLDESSHGNTFDGFSLRTICISIIRKAHSLLKITVKAVSAYALTLLNYQERITFYLVVCCNLDDKLKV